MILALRQISPGNSIGLLLVLTTKLPGLCFDRSHFGPYDLHIRLNDVPLKKIHLVLGIPNFLGLFDEVNSILTSVGH